MYKVQITYNSKMNEVAKLNTRLEKANQNYEKKLAKAKKLGVDTMTDQEHREWLQTVDTVDGWIVNKSDVAKNSAWFDLILAEDNIADIKRRLETAERHLLQAQEQFEDHIKQLEQIQDLKQKEELQKLEFEQEQKEWLKDGIRLEKRYSGFTPSGKKFLIWRNGGYTERSYHCFTLYIDGEVIFTSGEFWRAYQVIKAK